MESEILLKTLFEEFRDKTSDVRHPRSDSIAWPVSEYSVAPLLEAEGCWLVHFSEKMAASRGGVYSLAVVSLEPFSEELWTKRKDFVRHFGITVRITQTRLGRFLEDWSMFYGAKNGLYNPRISAGRAISKLHRRFDELFYTK